MFEKFSFSTIGNIAGTGFLMTLVHKEKKNAFYHKFNIMLK